MTTTTNTVYILAWAICASESREDDTAEDTCRTAAAASFDAGVLKVRAQDILNDEREDLELPLLAPIGGLEWEADDDGGWTFYDEEADLCLVITPRPFLA